jgi:hypothetical protein
MKGKSIDFDYKKVYQMDDEKVVDKVKSTGVQDGIDIKVDGLGITDLDYKICNDILNSLELGSFEDFAYGAILGSFCGDTCGSYL